LFRACSCVVCGIFETSGALARDDAFILPGLSSIGAGLALLVAEFGEVDAGGDAFAETSSQHEAYLGFHDPHRAAVGVPAVGDRAGWRRPEHGCGYGIVGFVGTVEEDAERGATGCGSARSTST
jgi:hypothetical protein